MLSKRIQNRVFWVGAQNPDLRTFDVVMHTDAGTSYNSYLIMGSEKTAVIDGVREAYATEHIAKISEHCDPAKLDYIVCNHTEPDHSGSLIHLLEMAPHATVLCTKAGSLFLKKLVPRNFKCRVVEDGERVSLGDVTLRFVQAPFLHWPDSLFTFAEEEEILFSGDVFSFHMAGEGLFDDEIAWTGEMEAAQRYYFDTLLAPFRSYVLDALEKIRGLSIRMIAPAHGPVRRRNPQALLEVYREYASDGPVSDTPKGYVAYVSCYGYTRELAEEIYRAGIRNGMEMEMDDIVEVGPEQVAEKIRRMDAVALGSPTVNRDALKPVWEVLASLSAYDARGKRAVAFGSFAWSGEAVRYMAERMGRMGFRLVDTLAVKLRPDAEERRQAYALGERLAQSVRE